MITSHSPSAGSHDVDRARLSPDDDVSARSPTASRPCRGQLVHSFPDRCHRIVNSARSANAVTPIKAALICTVSFGPRVPSCYSSSRPSAGTISCDSSPCSQVPLIPALAHRSVWSTRDHGIGWGRQLLTDELDLQPALDHPSQARHAQTHQRGLLWGGSNAGAFSLSIAQGTFLLQIHDAT